MRYSTHSTRQHGVSTARNGNPQSAGWWESAEDREDKRDRRAMDRRRAEILPALRDSESPRMKGRKFFFASNTTKKASKQ